MHGNSYLERRSARTPARTAHLLHILICAILLIGHLPTSASRAGELARTPRHPESARYEEVLAYDDGTSESLAAGSPGQKVAVLFQAPEWATHVIAIEYDIENDQVDNPIDPQLPTTMPFTAWVWRPTGEMLPGTPANDGYMPFTEPYSYPEEAWVRVDFPNAIDITNDYYFPDRWFFVGMEWEYRLNPFLGVDTDPPCAYASFRWNWLEWEVRPYNIMIRAVVWADTICEPAVIHVDAAGSGDYLAIQDAIDAASTCDTVVVAPGTYTGPSNRGITFGGKSVVLRSEEGRASTVIDCEFQDRGFFFVDREDEAATVRGFTVVNGLGSGAGIRCVNSWPTIIDCAFVDGDGENYGGGVYLQQLDLLVPLVHRLRVRQQHGRPPGGRRADGLLGGDVHELHVRRERSARGRWDPLWHRVDTGVHELHSGVRHRRRRRALPGHEHSCVQPLLRVRKHGHRRPVRRHTREPVREPALLRSGGGRLLAARRLTLSARQQRLGRPDGRARVRMRRNGRGRDHVGSHQGHV